MLICRNDILSELNAEVAVSQNEDIDLADIPQELQYAATEVPQAMDQQDHVENILFISRTP